MKATSKPDSLVYVGRIHESLHGFIHLTQIEKDLIDSPYVQRLRYIKQLGLANLVFPGGEHTRFSHSLGVLWVIDRICRHLRFDDSKRQTLRLAALLHDIGHFPLSHTLEAAYQEVEAEAKNQKTSLLVGRRNATRGSRKKPHSIAENPLTGGAALHERMSRHIIETTDCPGGITRILKSHKKFEPNEIGSIVVGECEVMLYNQLMHSDIDADQMDYLIRDASCLGIGYGQFAIEYLIECFQTKKLPDGQELLCVKEKGIHTVDHYLLAKYFYYVQVLYHRARWIVEEAAQKLYRNLLDSRKARNIPRLEDIAFLAQDPLRWSAFDDPWVMALFREAEQKKWLPRDCECLYDIVLRRRIPDCEYEKTANHQKNGPEDDIKTHKCAMETAVKSNGLGLSAARIKLHHLTQRFSVIKSLEDRIKQKAHKNEAAAIREDRDLIRILAGNNEEVVLIGKESASFAQYLQNIETHVFRAYKLKTS